MSWDRDDYYSSGVQSKIATDKEEEKGKEREEKKKLYGVHCDRLRCDRVGPHIPTSQPNISKQMTAV